MKAPENTDEGIEAAKFASLAPRPTTLAATGLAPLMVGELVLKLLLTGGVATTGQLIERLALAGPVLDQVLQSLRSEGQVETRARLAGEPDLRWGLTERGRHDALDAAARCGYVGPAPVPLAEYSRLVRLQSNRARKVTRQVMRDVFQGVVIAPEMLDRLGPALNSGRAIFLYGGSGTGKTFIAKRLARALQGSVLVPHAIAVDRGIVRLFDPVLHRPAPAERGSLLHLDRGHDPRWAVCARPTVMAGGELTADALEIRFDAATRTHVAPLQLKANGGLMLIDDLGRQRITPAELLNRWIVPMEENVDYLSLGAGGHFSVPFDVILVFSTNFDPRVLADEAFLRRIGYKIEIRPITAHEYAEIWQGVCEQRGIPYDRDLVDFTVQKLHATHGVPLLPCHPRDLLGLALDHAAYASSGRVPDVASLTHAWENYFVRADNRPLDAAFATIDGDTTWPGNEAPF
jgi:hypothetical protein